MYQVINFETKNLISETHYITWLKQQERVDFPVKANNMSEADGVTIMIDGEEKTFGIKKEREPGAPNMDNYKPLVKIVEVSGEPYILQQLAAMKEQVNAMQEQSTTTGEQVAEMYAVQAGDVVVKSELDAAYREGVNAI